MHGQRLIDDSGMTRVSLKTWKLTRPLFGEFVEAYCGNGAVLRWYELRGQDTLDGPARPLSAPTGPKLLLIDDHGSELWLSGCLTGYTGEGVSGSGYVLQVEGFRPEHVDLLPHAERMHVRKDRAEPVFFQRREDRVRVDGTWSEQITALRARGYFKDVEAL